MNGRFKKGDKITPTNRRELDYIKKYQRKKMAKQKKPAAKEEVETPKKKVKHFNSAIYLGDELGVLKVGDECTKEHLDAMTKEDIANHVE